MKSLLLALALSVLASPALALSCLPPDVARSYTEAAAAEQSYIVVRGTLAFDETQLPEVDLAHQDQTPPSTDIAARLTGQSLSQSGFEREFDRPITLRALCFGPWCGRAVSGTETLAFLEKTGDGYALSITPCGGFDFPEPTEAMLDKVVECFQGGSCKPEPF